MNRLRFAFRRRACDFDRRASLHRPGASLRPGRSEPTPDDGATARQWFALLLMVAVLALLAAVLCR